MKKIGIILSIGLIFLIILLYCGIEKNDINIQNTQKISVEEYENDSYFKNIISYKIVNNNSSEKVVTNVKNDKDIESLISLLEESDRSDVYNYENTSYEYYMIAYLFDNSAIKIEGNNDEIKISSLDDKDSFEYYKLKLEDDIQGYFKRKFEKNAKIVKYYLYKNNDKYGVLDTYGNKVLSPEYDYIKIIDDNNDLFICTKENKVTIIDSNKNEYYPNIGEKISEIKVPEIEEIIYSDVLKYELNDKYGILSLTGEKITDLEYSNIYNLDKLENYLILEKENSKKQLVKADIAKIEMIAEFDDIWITENDSKTEYIIYGKNKNETEQIIHVEEIVNKDITYFSEIIKREDEIFGIRYVNGLYFYENVVLPIVENTTPENTQNIDKN